jgi:hypothetical protein
MSPIPVPPARRKLLLAALVLAPLGLAAAGSAQDAPRPPVRVTVRDDKPVVVEQTLPLDPVKHIAIGHGGAMNITLRVDGKTMHLGSIYTVFHIDGQMVQVGQAPGRIEVNLAPLPRRPGGKPRDGTMTVYTYNDVRITQTVETAATRPGPKPAPGAKRRLDSGLVRYLIENKDTRPRKVGVRVTMDVFWVNNDGALFAAPNQPGKILDGVELTGKAVPEYLQVLQVPNLQNPGDVAHFTYNLGRALEPPTRVILTRLGAWRNAWDMAPQPANGDSAMGMYWDPVEVKPGGKRECAYAYGLGIATNPENDGKVEVVLGGSFEPGKLFDVTAYVQDPVPGQSLALQVPPGMELVEGPAVQAVPPVTDDGDCLVMWRARVRRLGEFALRVRASNSVTYTKLVTVARPDGGR